MNVKARIARLCLACLVAAAVAASACAQAVAADELAILEQRAIRAAIEHVAPAVVMIETVGGIDARGQLVLGSGPTTGLVVSEDGLIVSSAFAFVDKPSSILVTVADGSRRPARLLATDYSRRIVLLKVDARGKLPLAEPAPDGATRVGQWAIAVGRTFDPKQPNSSVGVVSATGRVWGKAIQTDAKVSPSNYGGPLVDIRGRVLGVLVPMSPTSTDELAGVEWYDSGIGFAVPIADVLRATLDLAADGDLRPGILGLSLKGTDMYSGPPVVATVRPGSPSAKAGLRAADEILSVDGEPVRWRADLLRELNRRYAGDVMRLAIKRGDESFEQEVELAAELDPYRRPFLGILPLREKAETRGATVRAVFRDGPAAKAGLEHGDTIIAIDGQKVATPSELMALVAGASIGARGSIEYHRGDEDRKAEVEWSDIPYDTADLAPQSIDAALAGAIVPDATGEGAPDEEAARPDEAANQQNAPRPQTGQFTIKLPTFANECLAYVPDDYDRARPVGLLVYLHGAARYDADELVERWRDFCDAENYALLAPRAAEANAWKPAEAEFVQAIVAQMAQQYAIDSLRTALVGRDAGGLFGWTMAFQASRFGFQGFAAIDAPLPRYAKPPKTDPASRIVFFVSGAPTTSREDLAAGVDALRAERHVVTVHEPPPSEPVDDESAWSDLRAWLATLDKI